MANKMNILLCLINKDNLAPERMTVYIWLKWFCDQNKGKWQVNYKELSILSGLTVKKLSAGIKHLELKNLIDVQRGQRVIVEILGVPDSLNEYMDSLFAEVAHIKRLKELANPIPTDIILSS